MPLVDRFALVALFLAACGTTTMSAPPLVATPRGDSPQDVAPQQSVQSNDDDFEPALVPTFGRSREEPVLAWAPPAQPIPTLGDEDAMRVAVRADIDASALGLSTDGVRERTPTACTGFVSAQPTLVLEPGAMRASFEVEASSDVRTSFVIFFPDTQRWTCADDRAPGARDAHFGPRQTGGATMLLWIAIPAPGEASVEVRTRRSTGAIDLFL